MKTGIHKQPFCQLMIRFRPTKGRAVVEKPRHDGWTDAKAQDAAFMKPKRRGVDC